MRTIKRYLVDFEFEAEDGCVYWLPLGFRALDGRMARQVAERIEHGLREKFDVQRIGPYAVGTYSATLLNEIRQGHRKGKPAFLEMVEYRLRNVEFDRELSFSEHMELALQSHGAPFPDESAVIGSIKNHTIPVRLIEEGEIKGSFLVINILSPDIPDQPRTIPAESVELGGVSGRYFRAKVFQTPGNEIAVSVEISSRARQLHLDADRMNAKIYEKSIELTGDQPDYFVMRKVDF